MRYKYQAGHESSNCIGRWGKSKKVLLVSFNQSKCTHKHHQRLQVSTFSKKSRRNDLIDNLQSLVNSIMASSTVGKLPKKRITFLWKFIIYRKIANAMLQTLQTDFMTNFQQKEKPSNILWDNGHVSVQLIFIPFLLWMSLISLTREA